MAFVIEISSYLELSYGAVLGIVDTVLPSSNYVKK